MAEAQRTPLYQFHQRRGAKMVPFAGYDMPVQYADGVLKEHLHCRAQAGLFDVSHMGQIVIEGAGADSALERLMPQDLKDLPVNRQQYGFLTNEEGGIIDDVMVTRISETRFHMVANAGNKAKVLAHLSEAMPKCTVSLADDRALLAIQGPMAADALLQITPKASGMRFMDHCQVDTLFGPLALSRSGYTGDDGFEISVSVEHVKGLAAQLLSHDAVALIGLGARDSLRLEAGLCLHGADIDETTSPIEAGLTWAIPKVRRKGGARAGWFRGAQEILAELEDGPARKRVGLLPDGRAPMRAGTKLYADAGADLPVGRVTSGGYGPSIERPMSMGYVSRNKAATGTKLFGDVRGKRLPVTVASMPFRPATYKR